MDWFFCLLLIVPSHLYTVLHQITLPSPKGWDMYDIFGSDFGSNVVIYCTHCANKTGLKGLRSWLHVFTGIL